MTLRRVLVLEIAPYFLGRLLRSYFRLASRELAPIGFSRKGEPNLCKARRTRLEVTRTGRCLAL